MAGLVLRNTNGSLEQYYFFIIKSFMFTSSTHDVKLIGNVGCVGCFTVVHDTSTKNKFEIYKSRLLPSEIVSIIAPGMQPYASNSTSVHTIAAYAWI
jgi:hypothetical protein